MDSSLDDNSTDYSGYKLEMLFPTSSTASKWRYSVGATPTVYGDSGDMTYYTNYRNTIWQKDLNASAATSDYPTGGVDPDSSWKFTEN